MTIHQFPAERLNEKGQCPVCEKKPRVYKGDKFCPRCSRWFDIETGEQVPNWAYQQSSAGMFQRDCKDDLDLMLARGRHREVRAIRRKWQQEAIRAALELLKQGKCPRCDGTGNYCIQGEGFEQHSRCHDCGGTGRMTEEKWNAMV
jgi:hypothetical protein